ncbi:MAG: Fatty acid desaturase [Verrucomicrobia bacterium]|nr:Fatty acid desaturase [Verrucomicrobiota bacterium]
MPSKEMPALDDLGRDLLRVTSFQRFWSILRPASCASAYFIFAAQGWWVPAVLSVAGLMFITYVSTSHDLLHRTLGFSRRTNEVLLAVTEMLVLRSGHAFRLTHLQHHRHFPDADDIEGAVAGLSWWRALWCGVGNQTRLFIWAWSRAQPGDRRWMTLEASWAAAVMVASVVLLPWSNVLLVYVLLVVTSSWLYPLATVWIPHRIEGKDILTQTHAVRGRLIPTIFLQHTYHLEHHLYPAVSSYHWRELARRVDPFLRARGVKPVVTP